MGEPTDSGDLKRSCSGFRRRFKLYAPESLLSENKINRSSEPAAGFGGLGRSGPNQGENRRCKATESGGMRGRVQIRGRILAQDAMGSQSSGEQLGGATLEVAGCGDGEKGRIRRWASPGPTLPHVYGCCAHSEHTTQGADLVSRQG